MQNPKPDLFVPAHDVEVLIEKTRNFMRGAALPRLQQFAHIDRTLPISSSSAANMTSPHSQLQQPRHAYTALIAQFGNDDGKKVKEVQMKLLHQGDERTNYGDGKSSPPLRQRARRRISM